MRSAEYEVSHAATVTVAERRPGPVVTVAAQTKADTAKSLIPKSSIPKRSTPKAKEAGQTLAVGAVGVASMKMLPAVKEEAQTQAGSENLPLHRVLAY